MLFLIRGGSSMFRSCALSILFSTMGLHLVSLAATPQFEHKVKPDQIAFQNYEAVKNEFLNKFSDKVKSLHGLDLVIFKDQESSKYLGGAQIENKKFIISYGADIFTDEIPKIDPNSFAIILCHELGHLFGGYPKKIYEGQVAWASSEGQADYFAAQICLKQLYSKTTSKEQLLANEAALSQSILKNAENFFQSLATIFDLYPGMQKFSKRPSLNERDPTVVQETNLAYPNFQCRLDTYRAGVASQPRPKCWFKN